MYICIEISSVKMIEFLDEFSYQRSQQNIVILWVCAGVNFKTWIEPLMRILARWGLDLGIVSGKT